MTRLLPLILVTACATGPKVTAIHAIPDDVTHPRAYAQGLCPGEYVIRYTPELEVACYE